MGCFSNKPKNPVYTEKLKGIPAFYPEPKIKSYSMNIVLLPLEKFFKSAH